MKPTRSGNVIKPKNANTLNRTKIAKKPVPAYLRTAIPSLDDVKLSRLVPKLGQLKVYDHSSLSIFEAVMEKYFEDSKQVFKSHPKLSQKENLNVVKQAVEKTFLRNKILFSIDVEAWEFYSTMVTEIGVSIYDPRNQEFALIPEIQQIHIIIEESMHKRNGKFVADNRDNFLGGPSFVMPAREAKIFLQTLINYYFFEDKGDISTVLVGHGVKGDISWFEDLEIKLPKNPEVLDTQHLWGVCYPKNSPSSLSYVLRRMGVPHAFLHNAGNDAYYTLLLALRLGDPNVRKMYKLDVPKAEPEIDEVPIEAVAPEKTTMDANVNNGNGHLKKRKPRKKAMNYEIIPSIGLKSALMALEYVYTPGANSLDAD